MRAISVPLTLLLVSGHLVLPVRSPTSPRDLAGSLAEAHQFLVAAARATVPRFLDLPSEAWGAMVKRDHVALPKLGRPDLVSQSIEGHSFLEVVNQCATLERLIDTLRWVETRPELEEALAVLCNPTTSSASGKKGSPRDLDDHDLVLQDRGGMRWKFAVSDVASDKDGNGKEKKDLVSLGVLPTDTADVPGWPPGRSFLVVSSEFASRLREPTRHGLRLGLFHYDEVKPDGDTRVFEVREGRASAA